MNIWYMNHYGGGPTVGLYQRTFHLAKAWQGLGLRVVPIVANQHRLLDRVEVLPPSLSVDGVKFITLPTRAYDRNDHRRLLNMWDYCRECYSLAGRVPHDLPKPDVIVVSSPHPFAVYPAKRLARQFGATLVLEIRDLWPLSMTEILGVSRWHPFIAFTAFTEAYALKHVDLVASVLPNIADYLAERGYAGKPSVWVPNGVELDVPAPPAQPSQTAQQCRDQIRKWKAEGRTVVVHAGSMGPPNGIRRFMRAVALDQGACERAKLAFLFFGNGSLKDEVEQFAATSKVPIAVRGQIPKSEVWQILQSVDIGYAGIESHPRLYRYGLALNKMMDYLLAGLPVILPTAPCGDPVSSSGAGIARAMETPESLLASFLELADLPRDERKKMGEDGRRYVLEYYPYPKVAQTYVDAISSLRRQRI